MAVTNKFNPHDNTLLTVEEAKEVLRIDNDYNDLVIEPLVLALPSYISTSTGLPLEQLLKEPLAKTVSGFLIQLWYNSEGTDSLRLNQVIESLLKTLSFMKKSDK